MICPRERASTRSSKRGLRLILGMVFNLRTDNMDRSLWESRPKRGFDLNSFNAGDYERAVESSNSARMITSVLYPNDNTMVGKELRLKQQYFWTAASLADMMRRFKNMGKPISEFAECTSTGHHCFTPSDMKYRQRHPAQRYSPYARHRGAHAHPRR